MRCMIYGACGGWCVVVRWDACAVYDRVHVLCIMHGALWVVCGLLCGAGPGGGAMICCVKCRGCATLCYAM